MKDIPDKVKVKIGRNRYVWVHNRGFWHPPLEEEKPWRLKLPKIIKADSSIKKLFKFLFNKNGKRTKPQPSSKKRGRPRKSRS